jgi:DNA-binding MarR family transcriptional regulator
LTESVKLRGCTNLKLRQLSRAVSRQYDACLAATGLKNTQYALLSQVVVLGPLRPTELARHMKLDNSTLTRNLQSLIAAGYVELGPSDDARSHFVMATVTGRNKRSEAQRAWKQAQLALNRRLGVDRVVALHALLDQCMSLLDEPVSDDA